MDEQENLSELPTREVATTICRHEYALDSKQDPNTNLVSVCCTKCPAGAMIDSRVLEIRNGKITPKGAL